MNNNTEKLHRCPCCGRKAFTHKIVMNKHYGLGGYSNNIADLDLNAQALTCQHCGQHSRVDPNYNFKNKSKAVFGFGGMAMTIIVFGLLFSDSFTEGWSESAKTIYNICSFALLAIMAIVTGASVYMKKLDNYVKPWDKDKRKVIMLKDNAVATINNSKYVIPYGVYGLKFKTETNDSDFKKAFPDGMVPAVFHPTSEGSLTYDVRIIKPEFVPEAVLFPGAKFLVEDYDGIFIAKGTVNKVDLDDTDEE